MESRRRWRWMMALCVLLLLPLTLWQTAVWTRQAAIEEIRFNGYYALDLYITNLQGVLETYEFLPRILAHEENIVRLLRAPGDPSQVNHVNRHLMEFNAIARASDTYVMDTVGMVLAASNWDSAASFVGFNYAFRPYFQVALSGKTGRYFGLGIQSREPGFYFSHPVIADGRVRGVCVVKISLKRLEAAWAREEVPVMITDSQGVVFITSRDEWRFKTLRPLDSETLERLRESRQYGDQPLSSLNLVREEPYDASVRFVTLREALPSGREQKPYPVLRDREYLVQTAQVPDTPWVIHVFSSTAPIQEQVASAMTLAGFLFASLFLIVLYLLQRRLNLRERQAYQRCAEDTLRRARDELAIRVEERTADLRLSNERLQQEIHERRRAEETLRQAQDDLIQASKLAALGQMSAVLVHELNQPLAAIRGYTENAVVLLERERYGEVQENLQFITDLTDRMAVLTSHLKTFARKTTDKVEPVSLQSAIAHALALLAPRARKEGIEIIQELPEREVLVQGNLIRLEQVLVNLLKNAFDAMQEAAERRVTISVAAGAESITLAIRDTGGGIAPDALPQLFHPFFTTK